MKAYDERIRRSIDRAIARCSDLHAAPFTTSWFNRAGKQFTLHPLTAPQGEYMQLKEVDFTFSPCKTWYCLIMQYQVD